MRRLKVQLIALLVLAVVLPAVPIAFTTHSLITRSLDPILGAGMEEGARAGLEVVREALDQEKARFLASILAGDSTGALTAERWAALDPRDREALEARGRDAAPNAGASGTDGARVLIPPERARIDGREVLVALLETPDGAPLWMTRPLPADLAARATKVTESVQLLESLRRQREPVVKSLIATFIVVYALVVALVLGLGLYLASRITRPMTALSHGIDRVAGGDLSTRVSPVGGGEARKLIGNFNEMTGRLRDQQDDLVRLEKLAAWRQMARRLAHEIKNPLTPIQLAAEQMRDEYRGEDPAFRRLIDEGTAIIEEEVQSLRNLVTDFSRFARLPEPRPETVDPRELLAEVAALYGADKVMVSGSRDEDGDVPAGRESKHPGRRSSDKKSPARVWCDRDQIRRALINLVGNALAAQVETGATEPVVIEARLDPDGAARFRVLDRGPGVPADQRRRIFEPDVTSKPDGMGLGLAIVENTVRAQGGSVEVADREDGGAVFTLVLPAGPREGEGGQQ